MSGTGGQWITVDGQHWYWLSSSTSSGRYFSVAAPVATPVRVTDGVTDYEPQRPGESDEAFIARRAREVALQSQREREAAAAAAAAAATSSGAEGE